MKPAMRNLSRVAVLAVIGCIGIDAATAQTPDNPAATHTSLGNRSALQPTQSNASPVASRISPNAVTSSAGADKPAAAAAPRSMSLAAIISPSAAGRSRELPSAAAHPGASSAFPGAAAPLGRRAATTGGIAPATALAQAQAMNRLEAPDADCSRPRRMARHATKRSRGQCR
jgi:hypothetical protein